MKELAIGQTITAPSATNTLITGIIEKIYQNSIIIANGVQREIIRKGTLTDLGYVFPEDAQKI